MNLEQRTPLLKSQSLKHKTIQKITPSGLRFENRLVADRFSHLKPLAFGLPTPGWQTSQHSLTPAHGEF